MRFRRRNLLIRPRVQLKLVLVFTGVSVLSLLLQYLFFMSLTTDMAGRMPSGGEYVLDELPGLSVRALLGSLAVLLPTSLAVGIALTFRIAGPVHKLEGYLRRLARGEALEPCRLRKGDELHELCDAVNAVAERLRAEAGRDAHADEDAGDAHADALPDDGRPGADGPPVLRHPGRRSRAGISMIEALIVMMVLSVAMGMFAMMLSSMSNQRQINRETALAAEAARIALERMRDRPFELVFALYNMDPADDPGGAGSAPGATFAVAGLDGGTGTIVLPAMPHDPGGLLGGLGGLLGGSIGGSVGPFGGGGLLGGGGGGGGGLLGGGGGGGGGLLGGGGGGGGGLLGGGGGGLLGGGEGGGLLGGGVGGLLDDVGGLVEDVGGLLEDVGDLLDGGAGADPLFDLREDYVDRRLGMPRDLNGDGAIDQRDHAHDYLILPVLVRIEWQGRLGPREFRLYSQFTAMER